MSRRNVACIIPHAVGLLSPPADGKCPGTDFKDFSRWREFQYPPAAIRSRGALIPPASFPGFIPKFWKGNMVPDGQLPEQRSPQPLQIILHPSMNGSTQLASQSFPEIVSVDLEP